MIVPPPDSAASGPAGFLRKFLPPRTAAKELPIHFFTIVLNGEPFIRYHEKMLAALPIDWHWHVVEGVAALKHDTAWSLAHGGKITQAFQRDGLSVDGTSEYLDDLARRFPGRVSIYRKAPAFWDGKIEMVSAPLNNIREECLLWEIDNDELWAPEQIAAVHRAFRENPKKTAAFYWCRFFVGPDKVVINRNAYGNPPHMWLRTWRFRPGFFWHRHEPPVLLRPRLIRRARNVAKGTAFSQDEMEAIGAVFQHYAYATEAQLAFKESYYGYQNALAEWRKLQEQRGRGRLADFLSWVKDDAIFDDVRNTKIKPLISTADRS